MGFFSSLAGQYVVQVLVHSVSLALAVEALIKIWRIASPATRTQFRLLYLVMPLVGWPVYQLIWPTRGSPQFRETFAILDTQQWLALSFLGIPGWGWVCGFMTAGTLLFAFRALVPTGHRHLLGGTGGEAALVSPLADKLRNGLQGLGTLRRLGARVIDQAEPVAYLAGVRRVSLAVSVPLLEILDDEELAAVLAHEEAHALRRDNLRGWVLLLAGSFMFYNPVAVVALQRISQDVELACDDAAVAATGYTLALASALIKAARHTLGTTRGGGRYLLADALSRLDTRVQEVLIARRVRRLTDYRAPEAPPLKWLKLSLTVVFSAALLFFVV